MLASAVVIIIYTIMGGFSAVATNDFIQSCVMSVALVALIALGCAIRYLADQEPKPVAAAAPEEPASEQEPEIQEPETAAQTPDEEEMLDLDVLKQTLESLDLNDL